MLIDLALNPASGYLTRFFKYVAVVPRKVAKLENPGLNFSEMPFVIHSRENGKCRNQNSFTGS